MFIYDLNHLEYISEKASVIHGGSTEIQSSYLVASSSNSSDDNATSSVKTISLVSDDPQAANTAERIINAEGITIIFG